MSLGGRLAEAVNSVLRTNERLRAENDQLRRERDKLQAFKDWVHGYLDGKGVPSDASACDSTKGGPTMEHIYLEVSDD